jgi:acetamidase/formamidase
MSKFFPQIWPILVDKAKSLIRYIKRVHFNLRKSATSAGNVFHVDMSKVLPQIWPILVDKAKSLIRYIKRVHFNLRKSATSAGNVFHVDMSKVFLQIWPIPADKAKIFFSICANERHQRAIFLKNNYEHTHHCFSN